MTGGVLHITRVELAERLLARRDEIVEAATNRALAIETPADLADPGYTEGLRAAISAAVDCGIASVAEAKQFAEAPTILISQARLAARSGVSLDTVLRRFMAGFTLFAGFLFQEADELGPRVSVEAIHRIHRSLTTRFDRLVEMISDEYRSERDLRAAAPRDRLMERVESLLLGEPVDLSGFAYEMGGCHLAVIASGSVAGDALQEIARRLDCRLLRIDRGGELLWCWLGRRRRIDPREVQSKLAADRPQPVRFALGEVGDGRDGWRFSHRQASAAWAVALKMDSTCVRYADVALSSAILGDKLLAASLRYLYLRPLETGRGERVLKDTLRAYFAAGGNVSSTAAALGLSRQTVVNRLRSCEVRLGRGIEECTPDLVVALRFDDLTSGPEADA